jgi:competence protein ComGF
MIENIVERFSKAASMQRWNDHIRPVEFTELDKQAHKMVIAMLSPGSKRTAWVRIVWTGWP